jgi:predicted nuclease of restriction endonuclease-like (RecB) superfamily
MTDKNKAIAPDKALIQDVRRIIEESRASVAAAVNTGLTMLYWRIGRRVRQEILQEGRATYGDAIVATLSRQLKGEYGRGFSAKNLRNMIRFAEVFPDEEIVSPLWRQLSWSHFREIIYRNDPLQREFYAQMCRVERWSVRTLREKIASMLYERTAISKKPESLIRHEIESLRREDQLSPDLVFKDPYLLDFLGLRDRYLEKDLEDAILRELERFLLELGAGFWPSSSSWGISNRPTKGRWNSICAGWTGTSARRTSCRPLAWSFARVKTGKPWNSWPLRTAASGWPST